jgi:hypothetical protein
MFHLKTRDVFDVFDVNEVSELVVGADGNRYGERIGK